MAKTSRRLASKNRKSRVKRKKLAKSRKIRFGGGDDDDFNEKFEDMKKAFGKKKWFKYKQNGEETITEAWLYPKPYYEYEDYYKYEKKTVANTTGVFIINQELGPRKTLNTKYTVTHEKPSLNTSPVLSKKPQATEFFKTLEIFDEKPEPSSQTGSHEPRHSDLHFEEIYQSHSFKASDNPTIHRGHA